MDVQGDVWIIWYHNIELPVGTLLSYNSNVVLILKSNKTL